MAVIPFTCGDVEGCLDGFVNPPSFDTCVALGATTEDTISLEYNQGHVGEDKVQVTVNAANGPQRFYIAVEDVFLWTRKARQFLNTCRDYMVVGGVRGNDMIPSPRQAMDMLCDQYREPETGLNLCAELHEDPKCSVDDFMSLHDSLEVALWSGPECAEGQAMRAKICECSCWTRVVQVYTPLFAQWSAYDSDIPAKLHMLQTMCMQVGVSPALFFLGMGVTHAVLSSLQR